jgi:hypothetical protein
MIRKLASYWLFVCAAGCGSTAGTERDDHQARATAAVSVEEIADDQGHKLRIDQGRPGKPEVVGCADGQREAFVDAAAYPRIAGCLASWQGRQNLRAPATGRPCGDDIGGCRSPADACALGWHVCGDSGLVADLRQIGGDECEHAGGGRFSAAISHCKTQQGCEYDEQSNASYECFSRGWCSEPVCCGADCGEVGQCSGGVWRARTHIPLGQDQGCGAASSRRAGGVLCCKN